MEWTWRQYPGQGGSLVGQHQENNAEDRERKPAGVARQYLQRISSEAILERNENSHGDFQQEDQHGCFLEVHDRRSVSDPIYLLSAYSGLIMMLRNHTRSP